jgi:Flp pilus assembly protein TadB
MRKLAALILFTSLAGVAVAPSWSQERDSRAEELRERRAQAAQPKAVADVQGDMVRARQALQAAKDQLYRAGNEWGGYRMTALKHVDEALKDVDRAEAFAKQHHYIK